VTSRSIARIVRARIDSGSATDTCSRWGRVANIFIHPRCCATRSPSATLSFDRSVTLPGRYDRDDVSRPANTARTERRAVDPRDSARGYASSKAMLRRFARNAMSTASPRNGIAPTTPSNATLATMRAISRGGAPSARASLTTYRHSPVVIRSPTPGMSLISASMPNRICVPGTTKAVSSNVANASSRAIRCSLEGTSHVKRHACC
jgi:hypothetical protein